MDRPQLQLMTCLLLLLAYAAPAMAGVYQWQDAEGRVHFGDKPPEEFRAQAQEIEAEAYSPGDDDEATRRRQEHLQRLSDRNKRIQDVENRQKKQHEDVARQNKRDCTHFRAQARKLGGRPTYRTPDGKEVRMPEDMVEKKREEIQAWIEKLCK